MRDKQAPLVLFLTNVFGVRPSLDIVGIDNPGIDEGPLPIFDRRRLKEADVVVFHIPDCLLSDIGDTPKYPGQRWVAWSMESKVSYPQLADQSFMRHFDLTMTYERSADIWAPYLPKLHEWRAVQAAPLPQKTAIAPMVMMQSTSFDKSGRNRFAVEVMGRIGVDSYGQYLRNRALVEPDLGRQTKLSTIARYHFCLALENSIAPDYVTEKLFDCLLAGVVPVYRGAPNADEFAPPGSYIDAEAYGGPAGLGDYLLHLLATPEEYAAFFAWRSLPLPAGLAGMIEAAEPLACRRLVAAVSGNRIAEGAALPKLPFGIKAFAQARLRRLRAGRLDAGVVEDSG